jgi:hypothetical protein
MNEIEDGVDPIRSKLESHIIQDGLADMETCADGIIAVSYWVDIAIDKAVLYEFETGSRKVCGKTIGIIQSIQFSG